MRFGISLPVRELGDDIAAIKTNADVNSPAFMQRLRALCDQHGIRIYLDATRMAENAFFIQEREDGYADKSIADILKEFCSYTDGAWMSAKKDNLVNIGRDGLDAVIVVGAGKH